MVRHDARVADERPHSREFSQERRRVLGKAVRQAREAAGHPFRPSFARLAGKPLGVRTLLKLEEAEEGGVSALVYEHAGRMLSLFYEDWSADTPLEILRGAEAPAGALRPRPLQLDVGERGEPEVDQVHMPAVSGDESEPGESVPTGLNTGAGSGSFAAEDAIVDGPVAAAEEVAPDPSQYADLEDFFRATIRHLIGLGLPRDAILRAAADVAEQESLRRKSTEGNSPTTSSNGGGTSG